MPPVLPRKRLQSDSPAPEPPPKRSAPSRRAKSSVFQTLDAPPKATRSLSQTKALLEQEGDDSELSDVESSEDEFEDVVVNGHAGGNGKGKAHEYEDSADEEWEDALGAHRSRHDNEPVPEISGDIELTLSSHPTQAVFSSKPEGKKGPSKIQRQIRSVTHCMHVQFLMFHNLMRNSWIQDKQVQRLLVQNMTVGCWKEVQKYWRDAGIAEGSSRIVEGGLSKKVAKELEDAAKWKDTGKNGVKEYTGANTKVGNKATSSKLKDKSRDARSSDRNQRDWGATSDRLEPNAPNLSVGDPLQRLLKYLSAYWKSKFKITAPSLRKRGYLSPSALEAEIAAWREDPSDADTFGERIESLNQFRRLAQECEGSRDIGQQLFTALLRGLGIEARMVASLQPVGFGWSQAEEGRAKNLEKLEEKIQSKSANVSKTSTPSKVSRRSQGINGTQAVPINLSDDDSSDLSSAISISSDSGLNTKSTPKKRSQKTRKYGDELPYPTYWTEVISHLTHTPICVSILPRSSIVTPSNPEALLNFYCRGAAADKAKQVFAYIIAFSSDGTAKDVTTRYLPKHQWPGKTKGFRVPVEKIPIHNMRGKVRKWEEWDWFKSVMRPFARDINKRQPWDEVEDEGDLVPKKREKPKDMDEEGGKETLQGYKNSAEYVLERHLRREEALEPGAKIVRYFTTGKGSNEKKEPVYRRKDIVTCKTVESWHKEGRAVKEGEQPLKFVPYRAVTVIRKREIEEREREEGEKVKQGLYSKAQTDWIIPDPIQDGRIPRNTFGNIDVYVPTMVPKGAVHIPLKGTAKICKKLGVDFAEACTGFEFGKQRAVPVLTGVVVAEENEDLVIDAWEADEVEKVKKEQAKKETIVLGLWKKFFVGLRIVERMKMEYGEESELPTVEEKSANADQHKSEWDTFKNHGDDFEGGFLRDDAGPSARLSEGFIRDREEKMGEDMAGGFLLSSQENAPPRNGELTIDHGGEEESGQANTHIEPIYRTPISLHSALQKPADEEMAEAEDENEDDHDEDDEPLTLTIQHSNRRTRGKRQTSRGRGGKRTSTTRRKTPTSPSSTASSPSSIFSSPSSTKSENGDENIEEFDVARPGKRKANGPPAASRINPKRAVTRKSDERVKSHFFASASDDETDLSPQKSSRGKGKIRGRGRGKKGRR